MIEVSKRIKNIVQHIEYSSLCDIGTDHGYIPIYAYQTKKINKAIAMDVNKEPLSKATEHIGKLDYPIETRLSNGLEKLTGEYETLTICGMGGPLVISILENELYKAKSFKQLILQPQSDLPNFRKFLIENGFCIKSEKYIQDMKKNYIIFDCCVGTDKYTDSEYFIGKNYIADEVFYEYINKEIENREKLISRVEDKDKNRAEELKLELNYLKTI